jgi:predicted nucleotidyltransferase
MLTRERDMAKIPMRPEEVFDELRSDYAALFGDDLIAIVLYGSGARGEYVPKKSDLNFLIILSEDGIGRLGDAIDVVAKWEKRSIPVPLFLTRDYIESSLDTFPLEFFNIQSAYQVIYGDDMVGNLGIKKDNLRLQCERELKGKLLLLRESFLQAHGEARRLTELIRRSLPACISIFKALLYLKGERIPEKHEALIPATAGNFGLDGAILRTLWQIKTGEQRPGKGEIKEIVLSYISEIKALSKQVDQMGY